MDISDKDYKLLTKYIYNDSNMPVVVLSNDWLVLNHNNAFSDLISQGKSLISANLNDILTIDYISDEEVIKEDYIVKKINCTLVSKTDAETKFHGVLINSNGLKYVIFEHYLLSEYKIIEELSQLNVEMSNLTRELSKKNTALESANFKINKMLNVDYLTGIYNRRFFFDRIRELISYKKRKSYYEIGLIQADIDFFKRVNDTYGHDVGDLYLVEFTKVISANLRVEDILSRVGGEEFYILIKCENEDILSNIAEKLRLKCHDLKVKNYDMSITASFGGSIYKPWESVDNFIKRVDVALYEAKENGRDQVVIK